MQTLILFDIDGTLAEGGPAKDAFLAGMFATFGTAGPIESHDFSGKTDPQIARELLVLEGFADADIDAGLPGLWDRYLAELESRIATDPMRLLPGVGELIEALEERSDVALGLVTGNLVQGARLKLGSVGLDGRFAVGGYGSDHEEREYLPGIAMKRAVETLGVSFRAEAVVVVGDTPRDNACGKHHGTRTVAVATGRPSIEDLRSAEPDALFEDFSRVESVMRALLP